MSANKIGRKTARFGRTFKLARATRAIRIALGSSALMLALAGSGIAHAGTCLETAENTISCNGEFTETVPGALFIPPVDMTLVLGDSEPTSVIPVAGDMGVDAAWGGNVVVVTHADITTDGADGIHQYGSTSASLNNYGDISTVVSAAYANAVDIGAEGEVRLLNFGDVAATGIGAYDVTAVNAYSSQDTLFLMNVAAGTIAAASQDGNAIGVDAFSYGGNQIWNSGPISADSVNGVAIGVLDQSTTGTATVFNYGGSIQATSTYGQAVGIAISSGGIAYVKSYSDFYGSIPSITATSGQDAAVGIQAYGQSGAYVVIEDGSVEATSNSGTATGILAESYRGDASIRNAGSIEATALYYSPAIGVEADTYVGNAYVGNTGSITATGVSGDATALLAQAQYGRTRVVNSGDLTAVAGAESGYYQHNRGIGIVATSGAGYAAGITSVTNSGNITATGASLAEGILASAWNGDVQVVNTSTGSIAAHGQNLAIGIGTGQDGYNSFGRYIDQHTYNVAIDNAGSITAIASGDDCDACYTNARGIQVFLNYGNDIIIANTGDIAASALGTASNNYDNAMGIDAVTYLGDIVINNAGSIAVVNHNTATDPHGANGYAVGILTNTLYGSTYVANSGDISVASNAARGYSMGIWASTTYTRASVGVSVVNSGNIDVSANAVGVSDYGRAGVFGIFASANYCGCGESGNIAITNAGDISLSLLSAHVLGSRVMGIYASASYNGPTDLTGTINNITIDNTGNIAIDVNVADDGSSVGPIDAMRVYGINAYGLPSGITINNSGDISAVVAGGENDFVTSSGIHTSGFGGVSIDNSGDIYQSVSADGRVYVSGISTNILVNRTNEDVSIDNSGDITLIAAGHGGRVYGVLAQVGNDSSYTLGDVTVDNSGGITVLSNTGAVYGIAVRADTATVKITNSGDIAVSGTSSVTGVSSPDIGRGEAYHGDLTFDNSGSIAASASQGGFLAFVRGAYLTGYGDIAINSSGSILAEASVYSKGTSTYGFGMVYGVGVRNYSGVESSIHFSHAGSITATAVSDLENVALTSMGISIRRTQTSAPDDQADAPSDLTIGAAGSVSATALVGAAGYGFATATGITVSNTSSDVLTVTNRGSVSAMATNLGAVNDIIIPYSYTASGTATATGLLVNGSSIAIDLEAGGVVSATATGAFGTAAALSQVNTDASVVTTTNAGALSATFVGTGGTATGATITSGGDVSFTNSGAVTATSGGDAVGVQLNGVTFTNLVNSGSITANSVAGEGIAVRTGVSQDAIANTGTITGALMLDDGDDTFDNGEDGTWNATGRSDFGAGEDALTNAGTINLDSASISLGAFTATGNVFTNTGTINVAGDSNVIDMGTGNPLTFTNSGTISFQDGATDDVLTIVGDFAGQGSIDLDVNQLNQAGDLLYITGNVAEGSVTTINTHVMDLLPTTATGTIEVVNVGGDSSADSFALGDVTFDSSRTFLTVQAIGMHSQIDTTNASADVFSIDFAVSGLSESGALAAAFVPAVQRLMTSQVGTWRQRMGVIDKMARGPSVWARAFSDNGTVNPSHQDSNFGQDGNLAFDQRSSGQEVGVDYALNEFFSVGLLVGKAQASQNLNGAGLGSSKLDGNTSGVYATWISPEGFYVDASYRRMSFDAKLNSAAGQTRTEGKADAFNVEAGYAWTLGNGLKLEPQLQYTRATVDDVDTLTGAMAGFSPDDGSSSRARAGVAVRKSFDTGRTVWTPYATLSAVREFDGDNAYSIDGAFFGGTSTEGTSALVEGGLNARIGNLSLSGGVNWQDGGALESVVGGQLGVRYSW